MNEILDFFLRLSENNNKPWFDAHRPEYLQHKAAIEQFALEFMNGIASFDPRIHDLQVRDITYRINRDIRFSPDKRPYKDWFGVYVCPHGKKSGMAGYYVHFQPSKDLYFLCGGLYNPTKEVMHSIRESVMLEPEEFHDAVLACGPEFQLSWDNALRRMPQGWNEQDQHSEYYRLRSYEIMHPLTFAEVLHPDFLTQAVKILQKTHQFNELLNKCYDYAQEL